MGRNRGNASGNSSAQKTRTCAGCGRVITWRRAWADSWHEIRWCSDACRRRGIRPVDEALEAALIRLLEAGGLNATISPDDAITDVRTSLGCIDVKSTGKDGGLAAHDLVEPARRAARRLVAQGKAQMLQHGREVDPSTARGPIQLRKLQFDE